MDEKLIVISFIFGFGLTSYSHVVLREYHYVNLKMTWTNAQQYCRIKHTDLATIESISDTTRLNRPTSDNTLVWIGLHDDPQSWKYNLGTDANSWKWSATDEPSVTSYENWDGGMPDFYEGEEACVYALPSGIWVDASCAVTFYFVCYQESPSGQRTYFKFSQLMTWEQARAYCRVNYRDLATIESVQETADMLAAQTRQDKVWIGLYRVPWMWSDRTSTTFKNWGNGEPNNYLGKEHCASEDTDHFWRDLECNSEVPFWCEGALKVKITLVRIKIQTDADISDPTINTQTLQQLDAILKSKVSLTDFNLRWKIQPKKEEPKEAKQN